MGSSSARKRHRSCFFCRLQKSSRRVLMSVIASGSWKFFETWSQRPISSSAWGREERTLWSLKQTHIPLFCGAPFLIKSMTPRRTANRHRSLNLAFRKAGVAARRGTPQNIQVAFGRSLNPTGHAGWKLQRWPFHLATLTPQNRSPNLAVLRDLLTGSWPDCAACARGSRSWRETI